MVRSVVATRRAGPMKSVEQGEERHPIGDVVEGQRPRGVLERPVRAAQVCWSV